MFTRAKYDVSDVLDPLDGFVPGYSRHASLRSVPDCGEPGCIGQCDHDREYEAYTKRMDRAKRACKVQQAYELGHDPDSVVCTCQLCEERVVFQNYDEE